MPRIEPVQRSHELTPAEFLERYERANEPVVIEGAVLHSAAARSWSPRALSERLGGAPATFKVSPSNVHPDFRQSSLAVTFARESATFGEFLRRITEGPRDARARWLFTGDEQFLLRRRGGQTSVDQHYQVLLEDLPPPALVPEQRLYTVWAWFSGPGVRTWLHYDNNRCHNLNAQITGRKECWLFPPEELAKLAPFPLGGANPAHNCSQIDVDHPDPERFPGYESARCLHATLNAGDLLFIPALWFHTFRHDGEFNSNLNFWWLPEAPIENAVARRQTLLELAAAAKLPASEPIASVLRELDRAAVSAPR